MPQYENHSPIGDKGARGFFFWVFFLYASFVIYGSLVPLEFHSMSLAKAVRIFTGLKFVALGKASRMDWTTNILLGIPVSFLGLCCFREGKSWVNSVILSILILAFSTLLSISAEFLQIFFSSRVPSINDIAAQLIGSVIGLILGLLFAPSLTRSVSGFISTRWFDQKLNFFFGAYIFTLLLLNVMPLDLSLSPADIYRKWNRGHISLVPFTFRVSDLYLLFYNTVVDTIKWIPVSYYLTGFKRYRFAVSVFSVVLIASSIELAQIFVMSRISDMTDIVTALVGGIAGGFLAIVLRPQKEKSGEYKKKRGTQNLKIIFLGAFGLVLWIIIIMVIEWSPFNFHINKQSIKHQLHGISLIPFVNYQANSFYHAVATASRKLLLSVPAGMVVSYAVGDGRRFSDIVNRVIVACYATIIIGWTVVIEAGQLFLPRKRPDITDILLELSGACIGYLALRQLFRSRRV